MASNIDLLAKLPESKGFIGTEFLTWLWYLSESHPSPLELTLSHRQSPLLVTVWIDDRVVLESPLSQVHTNTLSGGTPSQSPEAQVALQTGKIVKQAKVGFNLPEFGEFIFTLDSKDLSPKNVRLPVGEETPDHDLLSTTEARLQQLEVLSDTLDGIFTMFMDQRLNDDWSDRGLAPMKKWIDGKGATSTSIQ